MIRYTKKSLLIYSLIILAMAAGILWLINSQPHKLKLLAKLIKQPLDVIRLDYAKQNCHIFSQTEKNQGYFDAFVTGYCKPLAKEFNNRQDFLCAVGLNCSCPNGLEENNSCSVTGPFSWSACKDFNDKKTDYCNQTASMSKPGSGQVAADWSCFPEGSNIVIDNRSYLVTDKGSAITGRRFDIWFDNCTDAFKATGIYQIKLP